MIHETFALIYLVLVQYIYKYVLAAQTDSTFAAIEKNFAEI